MKWYQHNNIGIDFDGTLVEHHRSPILHKWVRENYLKSNFWIITFRDSIDAESIWPLLVEYHLGPEHFKGIKCAPDELLNKFNKARGILQWKGHQKFARSLQYHKVTQEELEDDILNMMVWKAKMCIETGCTLLIDDLDEMVKYGCQDLGIAYLHPDFL